MHINFRMLLYLLIAVAVFLVVFVFMPLFLGIDIVRITFGDKGKGGDVSPPSVGYLPFLSIERPLTEGKSYYAPSEIGCAIATSIAFDFTRYGTKGERSCFGGTCPVGAGIFSLKEEWPFENYATEDEKLAPYKCAACPSKLDEVCVTRNLMVQQVGDAMLCSSTIYTESKQWLQFGNSNCAGFNPLIDYAPDCPSGSWDACCPKMCPAGDMVKGWRADDSSLYEVLNDDFRHSSGQWLVQDGRRYAWAVYWESDPFFPGYVIEFPRIPTNRDQGSLNPDELVDKLGSLFKTSLRDNPSGMSTPELREVADWNFTVKDYASLAGVAGGLNQVIRVESGIRYLDYDMRYDYCSSLQYCMNAPLKGMVEKVEIVKSSDSSVVHTHYWPDIYDHQEDSNADYNVFRIRTNIPEDGGIMPGHKYRVILNRYRREPVPVQQDPTKAVDCECAWGTTQFWCEGKGGANVGYLGCSCGAVAGQACGFGTGVEGKAWCARDCTGVYQKYYYLTYVDYSMILVDMGAAA